MAVYYISIFLISLSSCLLLTPLVRRLSIRNEWFDRPSWRKVNEKGNMPMLGGVAIYLSFFISAALTFAIFGEKFLSPSKFMGLSIAALVIVGTGLVDDIKGLSSRTKLFLQILAALIVIISGFQITKLTNPFGGPLELGLLLSVPLTIFWIVGITNAINLIDGLDGLASGVVSIISLILFFVAIRQGDVMIAILALALAGSGLGFLRYNFHPARIFMGDTGSNFLGFMLAVITLISSQKGPVAISLIIPIIALGFPALDTFLAIIRRTTSGVKVFEADKSHFHHKLLLLEKSQRRVVLTLYFLTLCFGLIAMSLTDLKGIYAIFAVVLTGIFSFRMVKNLGLLEF